MKYLLTLHKEKMVWSILCFILFWSIFTFSQIGLIYADDITLENDYSFTIPSIVYENNKYIVDMDYYSYIPDSNTHLWSLASVKVKPTPVYVSVVIHYEDSFIYNSAEYYLRKRTDLLALAQFFYNQNIKINIQPDWAFLKAMDNFENDSKLQSQTGNKNILRYMVEDLGHEVNPHSHENYGYNISDVACMLAQYGINPGNIVGGLIVSPTTESKYEQYLNPIAGKKYPGYYWNALWLWGDATGNHTDDTFASGVWRPKNADNYYVHDDKFPLIAIGKYESTFDGVYDLVNKLANWELPSNKIYTATLFISQGNVANALSEFQNEIDKLKNLETEGKIIFASLEDVGWIWEHQFNQEENLYIKK